MNIFDSLFAETNEFNLKMKDTDAKTMGWLLVSLIQFLILLNITIGIVILIGRDLKSVLSYQVIIPVMVVIGILNYIRYKNKEHLDWVQKNWDVRSKKSKFIYNVISIIIILLLISLPITYGVLTNK